jgi:hypothetical protein
MPLAQLDTRCSNTSARVFINKQAFYRDRFRRG